MPPAARPTSIASLVFCLPIRKPGISKEPDDGGSFLPVFSLRCGCPTFVTRDAKQADGSRMCSGRPSAERAEGVHAGDLAAPPVALLLSLPPGPSSEGPAIRAPGPATTQMDHRGRDPRQIMPCSTTLLMSVDSPPVLAVPATSGPSGFSGVPLENQHDFIASASWTRSRWSHLTEALLGVVRVGFLMKWPPPIECRRYSRSAPRPALVKSQAPTSAPRARRCVHHKPTRPSSCRHSRTVPARRPARVSLFPGSWRCRPCASIGEAQPKIRAQGRRGVASYSWGQGRAGRESRNSRRSVWPTYGPISPAAWGLHACNLWKTRIPCVHHVHN
jgi:hypothetical protein